MIGSVLGLLACTSGGDSGLGREDTRVSCALDEANGLRASCQVNLPNVAEAVLTVSADGEPSRSFMSPEASEHSVTAWGLLPDTAYEWTVAGKSGTFQTRALPSELDALEIEVTGAPSGFDALLQSLPCGGSDWFVMFDGDGRVVWLQEVAEYGVEGRGYEWVPESKTLMMATKTMFMELTIDGREVMRLEQGTHFDDEIHHDMSRWGPYTYVLMEYVEDGKNVDRVDVYEHTAPLGSWHITETYDVLSNPNSGGDEWSHGNGLNVTADGQAIFSSLSFSSVVAFDADPASATFLEHQWLANGTADGLPNPDYTPLSPSAGFQKQHAAHRVGDELFLFDNTGDGIKSRAVRLELTHERNGLSMLEEWVMGGSCRAQGGAYPLDNGGMVATCAPTGDVWAFVGGDSDPVWTLNAWCTDAEDGPIRFPKGVPITIR